MGLIADAFLGWRARRSARPRAEAHVTLEELALELGVWVQDDGNQRHGDGNSRSLM